jgi:uncharacterized membrane protein YbhN (UPF0104 family)
VGAVVGVIVLMIFAARPLWAHRILDRAGRMIPFLRRPSLHEWVDHLLDGIKPLASWRATLQVLFWTVVSWVSSVMAGYVFLYAIFDHPTWVASMAMIALASFVVAVPAVPGNLGPFEAAVVFGLAGAELVENASDAQAVAFALLLHLVNLLLYISMGLIGLWVQNVSLGEVTQSAQKLRTRQENKP